MDILFNQVNNMDNQIKFTMECPDNEGSIPLLDTKCTPNSNHTMQPQCIENPHIQTDI